jgi:hypothetical protein
VLAAASERWAGERQAGGQACWRRRVSDGRASGGLAGGDGLACGWRRASAGLAGGDGRASGGRAATATAMSEQWAVWRRRASGGQAGEPAATDERRAGGRAGWVCATRRTERSLPDTLKREREREST